MEDTDFYQAEDYLKIWLGDHSYSWLSDEELLNWYALPQIYRLEGFITYSEYPAWNKIDQPIFDYSGYAIDSIILSEAQWQQGLKGDIVEVFWQQDIRKLLSYFFDEIIRLKKLHGQVRFVFGFDN